MLQRSFWHRRLSPAAALSAALGAFCLIVLAADPAAAEKREVDAKYKIFVAGIPLANASLDLTMDGGRYDARIRMTPTGIGTIVTATRTTVEAAGAVNGRTVLPTRYYVSAKDYENEISVDMRMSGGSVSNVNASPPLRPAPTRIPVTQKHMRGVVDPLSSGLMIYPSGRALDAKACNRTLEIFDGWTRYDLKLSYRRTTDVAVGDYEGPAVVCGARWVPVAGHQPEREAVKYLKANRGLSVTLIPIPDAGVLIPAAVELETKSGLIQVQAQELSIKPTRLAAAEGD